ncbi:MAG: hypothetical protein Q9170_007594 [Blastenia crenularia]
MPDFRNAAVITSYGGETTTSAVTTKEMERILALTPADKINFADEDGKRRRDTLTFKQAEETSQAILGALFEAWDQLKSIVGQYETTIQTRWLKKTSKQRKEILLEAWPEMSRIHRPDFEVLRRERRDKGSQKKAMGAMKNALRLPHINLEDLSLTNQLLLMLDSRSREFPSTFTTADRDSIRVAIRSKMLAPEYMRGYTMYLNGEQTRESYGRLVSWKHSREAIDKIQHGIAPDPGMGIMILEIQRDLLRFLVRCTAQILHDKSTTIPDTTHSSASSESLPLERKASCIRSTGNRSLTAYALEAPFRVPDAYDFTHLKSLVGAKCREVCDHFFLIREDPAYFSEVMHEACGHTREANTNPRYRPFCTKLSVEAWNEAVHRMIIDAYHNVLMWDAVSRRLDHLMVVYKEEKVHIQPGRSLPHAYREAFSRLSYTLDDFVSGYTAYLPNYMSAVPTFKEQTSNHMTSIIRRKPEIENLTTKNAKDKERLTWRLSRFISDLAVIAEVQRQLGLSTCSEYTLSAFTQKENDAWGKTEFWPWFTIKDAIYTEIGKGVGLPALLTDLKAFQYPSGSTQNAANVAKMRIAERVLDKFWEKVDQRILNKTGRTLKQLKRAESNIVTFDERQNGPSRLILGGRRRWKAEEMQTESSEEKGIDEIGTTSCSPPKITVKKKAFNTFAALFGSPVQADKLPGELPWIDFKKAMVNIGFSAEKLQGSAWVFAPTTLVLRKSIIFHEPHPESKLPMQWARRIARRLNRNFGWMVDTFVRDEATDNGEQEPTCSIFASTA